MKSTCVCKGTPLSLGSGKCCVMADTFLPEPKVQGTPLQKHVDFVAANTDRSGLYNGTMALRVCVCVCVCA